LGRVIITPVQYARGVTLLTMDQGPCNSNQGAALKYP